MKHHFSGHTDPGLVRTANQDTYHIDPDGRFFIVADGMGGHAGGQEASQIATQIIQDYLTQHWSTAEKTEGLLSAAFVQANQAILQDQQEHPERADMGTTVVVLVFREEQTWCAHVGDSRLYRFRNRKLEQMTHDHTWIAQALILGAITPDQARTHPLRHVLSQCLGRVDLEQVEVQRLVVQPGDRLLLCSDGLTEELSDRLIAEYLKSHSACNTAALALVDAAKDKGGRDNITVVVVAIETGGSHVQDLEA